MNDPLLAPFGLKWNPFSPAVPTEALLATAAIEHFIRRIERAQIKEGGFALVTGDPGMGKSVVLRLLAERLERQATDLRATTEELRADDLRFTPDEAAEFLNRVMGLTLTPSQIDALEKRTEGWIAGLQLAAVVGGLATAHHRALGKAQQRAGKFLRKFRRKKVWQEFPVAPPEAGPLPARRPRRCAP